MLLSITLVCDSLTPNFSPAGRCGLVLVRRELASAVSLANSEAALVRYGSPEAVDSVMVDGNWLMRGRQILAFDEAAVTSAAKHSIGTLRERTAASLGKIAAAILDLADQLRH